MDDRQDCDLNCCVYECGERDDYFPPTEMEYYGRYPELNEHNKGLYDFDSNCLGDCVGKYCAAKNFGGEVVQFQMFSPWMRHAL